MVVDGDAMFVRIVAGIVLQLALVGGAAGLGYAAALGKVVPSVVLASFVVIGVIMAATSLVGLVLAARQHEGPSIW